MAQERRYLNPKFAAALPKIPDSGQSSKDSKMSDIVAQMMSAKVVASRRRRATGAVPRVSLATSRAGGARGALLKYFYDVSSSDANLYAEQLDIGRIRRLLEAGADPNYRDSRGQTVMHEVAVNWSPTVAALLVRAGASVDATDSRGRTPLHAAAGANFPAMCKLLVRLGADTRRCDNNRHSAIFHAAKTDSAAALRQLAQLGVRNFDDRDWRGRTPLYIAAELDRSESVAELLQMGADAFVQDSTGQVALVPMVKKMPQLAKEALKQLHITSRMERRQYLHLFRLDPKVLPVEATQEECQNIIDVPQHSAISAITSTCNYTLVVTPVVKNLINQQWLCFGRIRAIGQLLLQLLTIALWTAFAVIKEWTERFRYNLPEETYRIVILVFAILLTVYSIADEIHEYVVMKRRHQTWQRWRIDRLQEDQQHNDPGEAEWSYLDGEIKLVRDSPISYFNDFWNILEWASNLVLIASLVTHFVDVGYPGGEGNLAWARWHVRLMAANILMQWLRLLQFVKPFEFLGAFIMMLGMMVYDLLKFILLYLEFLIPFSCVFWINFGGFRNLREVDLSAAGTLANYETLNFTRVSVEHFGYVNDFVFSMFRITLVDNYDYDNMAEIDVWTAQVLLVLWLAISAILFLNLLIAQLSETFKAVYDNAKATAVMEKAKTIQSFYETMFLCSRVKYHQLLQQSCNPLKLPYDDDVTEGDGVEEMQKATLQIRETLNEMNEKFGKMYNRQLRMGSDADDSLETDDTPVESKRSKAVTEAAERLDLAEAKLRQQIADFSSMLRDLAIVAAPARSAAN